MAASVRMGAMKSRILKLAALGFVAVASLLVTCWAVSLSKDDPKSAELAFGKEPYYVCLGLGKGNLILCDHFGNREVIHLLDRLKPRERGIAKEIRTSFPGLNFRHLTLTSGQPIWELELSLLISAILMALLAGLFFWMLRIRPVTARNTEPPNELVQRTAISCGSLNG